MACAVGAAEISPPNRDGRSASPELAVAAEILDGYVGFYQLNDHAVMTITLDGRQLSARWTAQNAVPLYPRGTAEFSYKDGQISFITEPDGQTTSLILSKYGVDMPMKRIDAAAAAEIARVRMVRSYRPNLERMGPLIILSDAPDRPAR